MVASSIELQNVYHDPLVDPDGQSADGNAEFLLGVRLVRA